MFEKKAFTLEEQVAQLQARGLQIKHPRIAEKYLINISYYRLGEYWYVMQSDNNILSDSEYTSLAQLELEIFRRN